MLHIRLDFNYLRFLVTSSFTAVQIKNMTDKKYINSSIIESCQMIIIDWFNNAVRILAYSDDVGINLIGTYTGGTLGQFFTYNYAQFAGNVTSGMTTFRDWIDNRVIRLDEDGYTSLQLFRLNDTRNKLSKTITFFDIVEGQFKNPIGIKQITIDVVGYPISSTYNYVYIKKLNRYYYISDVAFVSAELTRLILIEDVLMSWATLIRGQSAFVTRQENANNSGLVDERLPLRDQIINVEITPTMTPAETTTVNTEFDTNVTDTEMVFLSSTKFYDVTPEDYTSHRIINPPITGHGLPVIQTHYSPQQQFYFLTFDDVSDLLFACLQDDTTASFLDSVLWLPFNPITPFNLPVTGLQPFYIGDKQLKRDGTFVTHGTALNPSERPRGTKYDVNDKYVFNCPYLVIFDGSFSIPDSFLNREPYTNYEIWIPFVGFVKIEYKDFANKRLLIYYSMDMRTGSATAYIFDTVNDNVIWSGGCQLGIKLDITSTNLLENERAKQSSDLNTLMGLLSSAVSFGIGVATENPVAIVGGVLSAGKAIASNINTQMNIFTRASTITGSNDGNLYQNLTVKLRASTHTPVGVINDTYKKLNGLPYRVYGSLSTLTGYTEIGDIQFDTQNNDIYNVEIDEIVALLKNGVIL